MACGDRIGDAEPEPVAEQGVTVARKAAVKLLWCREARTGVAHADFGHAPGHARRECDGPSRRGMSQRVVDEVVEDLPYPHRVEERRCVGSVDVQHDEVSLG